MEEFTRLKSLIGQESWTKLKNSHVAVFGVGGVGGFVVESLARCGVGNIDLYDYDTISESNINRQVIAVNSTIGKKKVEVMRQRILDINPNANVNIFDININQETLNSINLKDIDYMVDAIDTITSKVLLIELAKNYGINIISCMGTGNKLNPWLLEIADISKTSMCPLAKVMRKLLKEKGIQNVDVLYSKEQPIKVVVENSENRHIPASAIFVPSIAGIMIAQKVFTKLVEK